MKPYAGTTVQFRADTQMHRIAEKLRAEYVAQIGHKLGPSDHGVILEYQLGNTSRRLDAMITGRSISSAENAVVVELKQWSDGTIGRSTAVTASRWSIGDRVAQ